MCKTHSKKPKSLKRKDFQIVYKAIRDTEKHPLIDNKALAKIKEVN